MRTEQKFFVSFFQKRSPFFLLRSAGMSQTVTQRSWLDRLWAGIADQGRAFARVPAGDVPGVDRARALAAALLSQRGEASGAAVARELILCLRALAPDERLVVLRGISEGFGPDDAKLRAAAEAFLAAPGPESAALLHRVAEPPRQELLRRMNMAPGGTAMLVALRRELQAHVREDRALRPLDQDLLHLFSSWFNRGFLELRRIDWETPASVLEKLITYEAVHEIDGWQDLRRRLLPDRRCFAFFHQALPNEPLIFVEVALTVGLADSIQPLLAPPADGEGRPSKDADTAIFYSISNCQDGLRGVSFGNFLIKQVVEELKAELPQLKRFATLSPVPGFRAWVQGQDEALTAEDLAGLGGDLAAATEGEWWQDAARVKALRAPLLRLAAIYLTRSAQGGERIDPVARFHLGNGARLERIDWLGNVSARGMAESFGVMVNYLYDPGSIEANHEAFVNTGFVARSAEVDGLMGGRKGRAAVGKAA
jgi:malonyl-CoA decarboxylase